MCTGIPNLERRSGESIAKQLRTEICTDLVINRFLKIDLYGKAERVHSFVSRIGPQF
jgi:hypothetical protein